MIIQIAREKYDEEEDDDDVNEDYSDMEGEKMFDKVNDDDRLFTDVTEECTGGDSAMRGAVVHFLYKMPQRVGQRSKVARYYLYLLLYTHKQPLLYQYITLKLFLKNWCNDRTIF